MILWGRSSASSLSPSSLPFMKLPNISTRNGFTLVEIILVLGLLTMLGGFGLFISMDFYRSYSLRASRNTLISTLHKARSQAISNIDQAPHGIRIESNQYTVFEGPTYASRTATLDEVIGAETDRHDLNKLHSASRHRFSGSLTAASPRRTRYKSGVCKNLHNFNKQ